MPVVNLGTQVSAGWHHAEILGVDFRDSTKGNPMLVVELRLVELGTLINGYLVVDEGGADHLPALLSAAGHSKIAELLFKGKNPSFELDDLVGKLVWIEVDKQGFVTEYSSFRGKNYVYTRQW